MTGEYAVYNREGVQVRHGQIVDRQLTPPAMVGPGETIAVRFPVEGPTLVSYLLGPDRGRVEAQPTPETLLP
jgi:hypothetical protein